MSLLLVKLTLAPALVVGSSLAGRRWGPEASGLLVALPLVAGPILLIVDLDHGAHFASRAAAASLLGLVALASFAVVFARVSRRRSWVIAVAAGWLAFLAVALGFSAAAQDLPPEEIVGFLDSLVCAFDALAEQYGVEKIKTVGDCYMAAAGFDGDAVEGAIAIGRFARAMTAVNSTHPRLGHDKLDLRVGIHCGPATAGVIGDTRFSYDVWGATVNAASRMQSQGEPGLIQVSEAFRTLAKEHFEFAERGVLEVRGIGLARTYFRVGV